jgi:putative ABC transport system substrate-binding protein
MRRRDFIAGVGTAAAWPLAARAQQRALPVVGFLHSDSAEANVRETAWIRGGLAETGYVEGQNVRIEYRWANRQYDRLSELMADLIQRRVVAILALAKSAEFKIRFDWLHQPPPAEIRRTLSICFH